MSSAGPGPRLVKLADVELHTPSSRSLMKRRMRNGELVSLFVGFQNGDGRDGCCDSVVLEHLAPFGDRWGLYELR